MVSPLPVALVEVALPAEVVEAALPVASVAAPSVCPAGAELQAAAASEAARMRVSIARA
jgi:hypothetical protein